MSRIKIKSILTILLSIFCVNINAQVIKGKVIDSTTNQPLGYAAVELRSSGDNTYIMGGSTNEKGEFEFRLEKKYPKILVTVSFLGFKTVQQTYTPVATGDNFLKIEMQEDSQVLNEVVVKGLSPAEKVQRLAYNVSLVETAKLKSTTMDLSNVIDKISGVKIRSTGGVGSEANVTLNGFSGRHVKIFIDGVPMDGMSSAFSLSNIPAGLAKRVEVYKGVVPIELGGDALGGAINIVTDNSRRTRVNASYSYGSFNTHKSNVYAEHTTKNGFYVSLNAYQNYSDNDYKVHIDSYTKGDGSGQVVEGDFTVRRFHAMYHNEAAILKVGVVDKSWADRLLFGFTGGYEYKQTQNGSTMDWVYGARYTTANTLMPQLTYEKKFNVLKGLHVSLNGNYNLGESYAADTATCKYNWLGESYPTGVQGELSYMKYRYRDHNGAANFRMALFPADGQSVSLSSTLTTFSRSGKDETAYKPTYEHPSQSMKLVTGLSYKYDYKGKWNTSAFVKHYLNHLEAYLDPNGGIDYQDFSNTTSYWGGGLASTYFWGQHTQLRLSYEYALRLPTSRELFGSGDDIERGNSDLKPESSNNINVSVTTTPIDMNGHRLTVDAAFQYREINDYIRRTTNNDSGRASSQNDGRVRNLGTDWGIRYTWKDIFFIGGNFSYIDMRSLTKYVTGTQQESKNYKERIPAISYMYGNGEAGLTLRNVFMKGATLDIHYMMNYIQKFSYEWNVYQNEEYDIPTQFSHDLFVSYNFGKKSEFTVSAECTNIFDARLYDNFKMQKPGRAFAVKFGYSFMK
ncbi:MAG TPA: TonB-dependent receptor plug domain-containing protein [Mediterranea massiliensis]|uniref:TonB-dependent receptor plug domain-containing protein n=1 Tax=Mediterranea massiliensis TaxID=1841865 RepID=A0A921LCV8_9BACT|nr:TonB-dependent receptor [Mediterranea massiliensis]HJF92513.1 TonB-dependent receptor plug domain-containing protein [Mediterranea massiliensis]